MLAPYSTALHCEWRALADLAAIADAWGDLAARAAEPNVFYEPAFALNAAPALGRGVGAVLVWAQDGRLVGLFPLERQRARFGLPLALLAGWTHPYAPLGTPLVDRSVTADVVAAFLDHVAGEPDLPKLVLLPYLAADGPVAAAIAADLAGRGGRAKAFGAHRRAMLMTTSDAESYLDDALGKKKRRELARQRRRLADEHGLDCEIATAPERIAVILTEFLALEAAGWKGRAGTAAAQHDDIARFMAAAVAGLAAQGKAFAACLRQGERAIAATIVLTSGTGAWGWKIAYDEGVARGSPGVQLLLDVTERLIAEPDIAFADSCATPDHAMIDHVWRERLAVEDRLIALTPNAPFALACRLETLRRRLVAAAKAVRERLRGLTVSAT